MHLERYKGFAYTTATHKPDAPRARAMLATSREMSRDERVSVGRKIEAELGTALGADAIKFDDSVYRSEQPCYTPVTASAEYRFDGQVLDVDTLLQPDAPPPPPPLGDSFGSNLQKAGPRDTPEKMEAPQESPQEIGRVRELLSRIPSAIDQGCNRKQYLDVIWSIAATGWTCAEQLAREWCGKSPADFVEADFVRDWSSYNATRPDGSVHFGTLHRIAKQYPPADDWPDPMPIEPPFPKVIPLDTSWLPVAFKAFVDDHSELMQVPPDMIAAPLMVAAAACLGNILAIAPKAFDTSWLVVPVLWGGCVGRPGLMKSPAISIATKPLDPIEQAMASDFAAKQQQYKIDKLLYDARLKAARTAAGKNPTNTNPVSLPPEPEEPQPERLVVNDSTAQKLGDILRHSPRGVLVQRDEIVSLLESLAAEGQEGARGFYLEAWNGLSSHRVDRIGRGSLIIPRLAIWIFGGIQPGKLQPYVKQATTGGGGDDGLLQRFQMLVWPDVSKNWTKVDRPPNLAAHAAVDAVFAYLRNLDPVAIGAIQGNIGNGPAYLHFTTEAQALFDQWWANLEHSIRTGDKHPALESHQSKYKSLIPVVALVIHLADGGTGPVPLAALEKAIRCGTYLWSHAKRVYASATNSTQASAAALASRITSGKVANGFSARGVYRNHWAHLTSPSEVSEAIEWLIDSGWVRRQAPPTDKASGRQADIYLINPRVLTPLSPTPAVV